MNNNSAVGHMYVTFKGNDGSVTTFGHFPGSGLSNVMNGVGGVQINTDKRDHESQAGRPGTNGVPNESRDFHVSDSTYHRALDYANDAASQAGNPRKPWGIYDPLYNSCVDFAWNIMGVAGLNTKSSFEGWVLPRMNRQPLDDAYFDYYRRPEFNREGRNFSPNAATNTQFTAARNLVIRRDPLVLDLDGDGLELVGASGSILFDHNADGIKTGTGWARPDDGFLVRDLNGNGTIDTGRELFGVDTIKTNGGLATDGFDALRDIDTNGDGFITNADTAYADLRVWRDLDQNGTSTTNELFTLTGLGITSIRTNGTSTGPQAGQIVNNNLIALSTTYIQNGVTRTVGAIDLEANNFFTEFPPQVVDEAGNPVAITAEAEGLPQMNGAGMVRDMRCVSRRVRRCIGRATTPDHQPGHEHHRRDQNRAKAGD